MGRMGILEIIAGFLILVIVVMPIIVVILVLKIQKAKKLAQPQAGANPAAGEAAQARFCQKCGKPLAAGHNFCDACGTKTS
jgi:hypothetical protein